LVLLRPAFSWFPILSTCCPTQEKWLTRLAFNKNLHHLMLSTKSAPPHAKFLAKHNAMMTSISNVQHII
jgi:hypothetical protein